MARFSILAAAVLVLAAASVNAGTIYPTNNGFEVPDLGAGGGAYEYGNIPSWTVSNPSGGEGIAANGSAFGVSGAPNGNSDGTTSTAGQAALLQGGDGTLGGPAAFYQTVSGFSAGTASINFLAEQRPCCNGGNNEQVNVYLDGNLVGTYLPTTAGFTPESTAPVSVTAGSHVIGFAGLAGVGDTTAFIDSVSITNTASAVPEPASLALLGLGGLGLVVARRRRLA